MQIQRFPENPLITPADVQPSRPDYEVVCAFNPAAIRIGDEIILLLRIAERPRDTAPDELVAPVYDPQSGDIEQFRVKRTDPGLCNVDPRIFHYRGSVYLTSISHLRVARSHDGRHFQVDSTPAVFPLLPYETYGLEDPRITLLDDRYYITYKAVSAIGICTALLVTEDFRTFERKGIIFCPENIDVVVFPERIGGRSYALTRPVPAILGQRGIWLASSVDTLDWGRHQPLLMPRKGFFDSAKTGGSCVPIATEKGWLEIYHGADEQDRYCLGAALLDRDNPSQVLARSIRPLLEPKAPYETEGFYGNVVFSCGAVTERDGTVIIYYGASDEHTAAAQTSIDAILESLE